MAHYSTSNAISNIGKRPSQNVKKTRRRKLTSPFFTRVEDNEVRKRIQRIYAGKEIAPRYDFELVDKSKVDTDPVTGSTRHVPDPKFKFTGPHIAIFKKILSILVPELVRLNTNFSFKVPSNGKIKQNIFSVDFDEELDKYVRAFQTLVNLTVDGKIGPRTISAMDLELAKIKYYKWQGIPKIGHNASLCEDKSMITVVYKETYLYTLPDETSPKVYINTIKKDRAVHVIQDIPDNIIPGWVYVQIDLIKASGNVLESKNGMFGYMPRANVWMNSEMPDNQSKLHNIENGDTVYSIIKQNYYKSVGTANVLMTKDDEVLLRTEPLSFVGLATNPSEYIQQEQYNRFRFYVNLLLYANNPKVANVDGASIYLKQLSDNPITEQDWEDLQNITASDNPDVNCKNYDYFLNVLTNTNNKFLWKWDNNNEKNTIVIKESTASVNYYLWVPSQKFADQLYYYINHKTSYFSQKNNEIREFLKNKWRRGFGVSIEGKLGATFVIPVHLEVGGTLTLSRKFTKNNDDVVMVFKKSGRIKGGLDVGVTSKMGVGFFSGSGKKKINDKGMGTGMGIDASASASLEAECTMEFEIPLYKTDWENAKRKDLGAITLLNILLGVGTDKTFEFAATTLVKAFTDYNIDPMNYLTKFDIHLTGAFDASAGTFVGMKLGDQDSKNTWNGNNLPSRKSPPWHLRKLLGMMNIELGISVNASVCLGYSYTAEYDDKCFDIKTGARAPAKFTHTLYTNASLLAQANADIPAVIKAGFSLNPYVSLKIDWEYVRPLVSDQTDDPDNPIFIPNMAALKYNGRTSFTPAIGNGNWDDYDGSAFEIGLKIKGTIDNTTNNSNPSPAIDTYLSYIDYLYFKKRFSFFELESGLLKGISKSQQNLRNIFLGKKFFKFGLSSSAYFDVEFRLNMVTLQTFQDLYNSFINLLHEIRSVLAKNYVSSTGGLPEEVKWASVLLHLPQYWNALSTDKFLSQKAKEFIELLSKIFEIYDFSFHGELAFGGGFDFEVAAGLEKIGIYSQIILTLMFDIQFISNNQWMIDSTTELVNGENVNYQSEINSVKKLIQENPLFIVLFSKL
jgi:hypothetical protein